VGEVDEEGAWVKVVVQLLDKQATWESPKEYLDMAEINEIKLRSHKLR
jgi:hypothetical protein